MPPRKTWVGLVEAALAEDIGPGDATSDALIPPDLIGAGQIEVREPLILAGINVSQEVFVRHGVEWKTTRLDGAHIEAGGVIATVRGSARGALAAERTALNFLQRLSGIATLTRRYCEAVQGTRAIVVDTRKTTPGWRTLEKYAVRCGGGTNHRMGLYDGILIKDNHIQSVGSVVDAVKRARVENPSGLRIQVEVESLNEAHVAIQAGADALLIDNRTPDEIKEIVEHAKGRVLLEASGGISLQNIAEIARTGVDRISVGAITHSAPAPDIALEWNVLFSI